MSEEAFEVECERGLRYAVHDGTSLAGDFYKPTRAANAPVVVAAHGGAWKVGDATDFQYWGSCSLAGALLSIRSRIDWCAATIAAGPDWR